MLSYDRAVLTAHQGNQVIDRRLVGRGDGSSANRRHAATAHQAEHHRRGYPNADKRSIRDRASARRIGHRAFHPLNQFCGMAINGGLTTESPCMLFPPLVTVEPDLAAARAFVRQVRSAYGAHVA